MYEALRGRRGVMIDVGAHSGSTLEPFANDGWEVHAFEPDPANRIGLERGFGRHPNVTIVPKAVSDRAGEMPLFTSAESTGISSLTPFTADHVQASHVDVITLREYMFSAGIAHIDFLKIDVEGLERNVLAGHDWTVSPRVILLEFEDAKTLPLGYSWRDLADGLVARGYQVLVSEWFPIDSYGAAHRWRRANLYPTDLADPDAWGNLIAARTLDQLTPALERVTRRYQRRLRIERLARAILKCR